jgi:protein FAM32A
MSLENVVKSKLKLKGKELPSHGGIKKKKKKSKDKLSLMLKEATEERAGSGGERSEHEGEAEGTEHEEDHRTAAEKKYDEALGRIEARRLQKEAAMSHRERVQNFNERLASLTEHYDIPKVGPG